MKKSKQVRVPTDLYLYNLKFAWNCPYCGFFNVGDTHETIEEIVVQCFCCQRKRKGVMQDQWYIFTPKKTKNMESKQKKYKSKLKMKPKRIKR